MPETTPYEVGPFDSSHLYLQWGGKLPGNEIWSCGLRMAPVGASTSLDPGPMLTATAAAVAAYHANGSTQVSPRALLEFTKLNYINPDGRYAESTTFEHVHADVAGGGTEGLTPPNQIAMAVSLTTGVSRGPAHRGRFFLPLPTFAVATTGLVNAGARDALKTETLSFIAALNAVSANYKVAVYSRKDLAPAHRLVTGVEVGLVLDTQRRRRNKLVESY